MNKKFLIGVISVLLILSVSLYIFINDSSTQKIVISNDDSNKRIVNNNALTMMYETEAGSGEYQVSSDTMWPQDGYIFNETLSKCENGGTLSWDSETNRVVMQTNSSDKCYIYFDATNPAATIITDLFNEGSDELSNLDPDGNIRYNGTNPNNYVLFNNELWRIIGVFNNKLKIVRDEHIPIVFEDNGVTIGDTIVAGMYGTNNFFYWNYNGTNNWETATLKIYLNGTYYNSIEQSSRNLISEETWYLGGFEGNEHMLSVTAIESYETERSTNVYPGNPTTTKAYIGLIYPSDLFYSKLSTLTPENNSHLGSYNWLGINDFHWLISSSSVDNQYVLSYVSTGAGAIITKEYYANEKNSDYNKYGTPQVHPTLYLKSTVAIISGNGSEENPYILA